MPIPAEKAVQLAAARGLDLAQARALSIMADDEAHAGRLLDLYASGSGKAGETAMPRPTSARTAKAVEAAVLAKAARAADDPVRRRRSVRVVQAALDRGHLTLDELDLTADVERRVANLAEHVRRVVDSLPPLTDSQRARLAAVLAADPPAAAS